MGLLTLGLDTTTGWGCLGLLRDGEVLAETGWQVGRNQAEQFLPVLAETMTRVGLTSSAIDLIAAGVGPGSYTGIRIGLAMAEALAFSLKRPVTGVNTLAALAQNAAGFPGPVCAALLARRSEVYAAVYQEGQELVAPAPFTPGTLLERLGALGREAVFLLGNGAGLLLAEAVSAKLQLLFGREEHNLLRGTAVARLGASQPVIPARPLYLRRTEAEERLGICCKNHLLGAQAQE